MVVGEFAMAAVYDALSWLCSAMETRVERTGLSHKVFEEGGTVVEELEMASEGRVTTLAGKKKGCDGLVSEKIV